MEAKINAEASPASAKDISHKGNFNPIQQYQRLLVLGSKGEIISHAGVTLVKKRIRSILY